MMLTERDKVPGSVPRDVYDTIAARSAAISEAMQRVGERLKAAPHHAGLRHRLLQLGREASDCRKQLARMIEHDNAVTVAWFGRPSEDGGEPFAPAEPEYA